MSAAVIAATSMSVYAQDDASIEEAEQLEEIQVYGIRRSIEKSVDDKRFATNIKDTINAEDIGKSTDQNIAEALSRVTGVSAQTRDGEGTTITVRGANAQQNNISLNGVPLGATDFSQAVDLSAYSSDILSKIEVVKTPSADHEEGALGANVNLVTVRPLDSDEALNITIQGRQNDLSDNRDYKLSFSGSQKFLDDTLGVALTVFDETNSVRKDEYSRSDFRAYHVDVARDQNGNVVNDVWGVAPNFTEYSLNQNEYRRQGVNLGVQWMATDTTEVMLNASHNVQDISNTLDQIKVGIGQVGNMVGGIVEGVNESAPSDPSWTDPQEDWYVIDSNTNTFTKNLSRNASGQFNASLNEFENINDIVSLEIKQDIGDSIVVSGGINYSKAEQKPGESYWTNLQNYGRISAKQVALTSPDDIEPVGYDCSSGRCVIVSGTGLVDFGTIVPPDAEHITDNRSTTLFNPQDYDAFHLGYQSKNDVRVEDTQKSAYVDLDWDVEVAGLTKIEAGFKYSQREKAVDNQLYTFNSVADGVVVLDPNGNPVALPNGLLDIDASFVNEGKFPVDDFMKTLGYADGAHSAWTTIDPQQAFAVAQGDGELAIVRDDTETRNTKLDNFAVYIKGNFAFLDDKLTGDVGVRYVRTTVESAGYSGANFYGDVNNTGIIMDPFKIQALRDQSNPACPAWGSYLYTDSTDPGYSPWNQGVRWERIDGNGFDTKGTADYSDDTALPAVDGPCYDWTTEQDFGWGDGSGFSGWWNWRHSDISTDARYVYFQTEDGKRVLDENGNLYWEDRSRRSFAVEDKHDYGMLLPSLNLNYLLTDDLIGRFAVSKTMARPQIDSLRPGFKFEEDVWTRNNTITMTNTKLDPLTSNNLDLSLEWYFSEGSLLAGGVFYKDMTNFEESQTILTYSDDLRDLGLDPNAPAYNPADLVKPVGSDLAGCFPKRMHDSWGIGDWFFSGDPEQMCAMFQTTTIKNGKGASIKGLELQYVQTFDMLPGFLSGLGTQLNYTYQSSEYDQEVSSIDPSVVVPALPVAYTPEHSYNATVFWERNGHQVRLAYQGQTDQLAQRSWGAGALWQEARATLDLSATYQLTDTIALSFNAVNLTDAPVRTYFTSRFLNLGGEILDEGSPLSDGATDSRTVSEYKTGRSYRLGISARF
ncbi:TonB-dependent receptor [Simiduia agarivorans]|uniref:TonB-dependent receptor n=1 Tax=Simiduia agarivorans TaxID=447471 RepID=UPI001FCA757B|nr:TonB-dependent receptor [Simiduia agarivorans]